MSSSSVLPAVASYSSFFSPVPSSPPMRPLSFRSGAQGTHAAWASQPLLLTSSSSSLLPSDASARGSSPRPHPMPQSLPPPPTTASAMGMRPSVLDLRAALLTGRGPLVEVEGRTTSLPVLVGCGLRRHHPRRPRRSSCSFHFIPCIGVEEGGEEAVQRQPSSGQGRGLVETGSEDHVHKKTIVKAI